MTISIQYATIVSMIVQALFFGIYAVLFIYTQYILFSDPDRSFNKLLWTASFFMFLVATAQLVLDAQRFVVAFDQLQGNTDAQLAFLGALGTGSSVAKNLLYQIQTYIGDACIIYRTFVLYGKNWLIILVPLLLLVGGITSGTGLIYEFATSRLGAIPSDFQGWAITFIIATLIDNLICTACIVARIWRMSFKTNRAHFTPIIVIVESGGVYTASLIVLSVLGGSASPGYVIALDQLCPIIGITFVMIILRLHQESTRRPSAVVSSNPGPRGVQSFSLVEHPVGQTSYKGDYENGPSQKPLPISVMVQRETNVNQYV